MGFAQLWSVVTGRRSKDARVYNDQYEPPRRRTKQVAPLAQKCESPPEVPQQQKSSKRKSQRFSLSYSKSEALAEDGPRKRRSWYGGLPSVRKDAPDVRPLRPRHDKGRPIHNDDQLSALPSAFEKKQSYRRSMLPINANENQSTYTSNEDFPATSPSSERRSSAASAGFFERRQSTYKTNTITLPPPSAANVTDDLPGDSQTQDKRKSKRMSFRNALRHTQSSQSVQSTTSRKGKRSSWLFHSSNPDTGDDEYHNNHHQTPKPSIPNDIPENHNERPSNNRYSSQSGNFLADRVDPTPPPSLTHQDSTITGAPRRVSYNPRNAAHSFLKSTSTGTEEERTNIVRRSQGLEPLQQIGEPAHGGAPEPHPEWEKLRLMLETLERRQQEHEELYPAHRCGSGSTASGSGEGGGKFANEKALRALEFGGEEERGRSRTRPGCGGGGEGDGLGTLMQER